MRFLGTYPVANDEKRRTQIPHRWRSEGVEPDFFMILLDENMGGPCVRVMEPKEFDRYVEELNNISSTDPNSKKDIVFRSIGSNTEQVTQDKAGRLTIPSRFFETLQLEDSTLFVGCISQFELWKPDVYSKVKAENSKESKGKIPPLVGGGPAPIAPRIGTQVLTATS